MFSLKNLKICKEKRLTSFRIAVSMLFQMKIKIIMESFSQNTNLRSANYVAKFGLVLGEAFEKRSKARFFMYI
jgi:hypothetical protein